MLAVCTALVALAVTAGPNPHQRGPQFLLVGVACSPIALLRRWPLAVLAAATVAKVLLTTRGIGSLPFAVVLGFASYFAASRLPRRVSITAAAASAAALGGALVYATFAVRHVSPATEAIEAVLPLAAAWFIGDSVAARRRYQAGLAEQAERERAAEAELARQQVREERVRIARELHDVVAHTLAVITVQAGVGRRLMGRRPEEASTALESIETIGRTAQEELRVVLGLLRDEETRTAALAPAPGLVDVKELVETVRAAGTPVDLQLSGTDRRLSRRWSCRSIASSRRPSPTSSSAHREPAPRSTSPSRLIRSASASPMTAGQPGTRQAATATGPGTGSSGCASGSARSAAGSSPSRPPIAVSG